LLVFWGAGIVFFLAKIINLHNDEQQGMLPRAISHWIDVLMVQQGYWVELCALPN
jgi:hypothetical protein